MVTSVSSCLAFNCLKIECEGETMLVRRLPVIGAARRASMKWGTSRPSPYPTHVSRRAAHRPGLRAGESAGENRITGATVYLKRISGRQPDGGKTTASTSRKSSDEQLSPEV